jgi:hypothetical protein
MLSDGHGAKRKKQIAKGKQQLPEFFNEKGTATKKPLKPRVLSNKA